MGTQPKCTDLLPSPRTCCLIMLGTHRPPRPSSPIQHAHIHTGLLLLAFAWHSCLDTSPRHTHRMPACFGPPLGGLGALAQALSVGAHLRPQPRASRSGGSLDWGLNLPEGLVVTVITIATS